MKISSEINLVGWYPDIYKANKPKGMTDDAYINAIVTSWLSEKDAKKPIPKSKEE